MFPVQADRLEAGPQALRERAATLCSGRRVGGGAASILAWQAYKGESYKMKSTSSGSGLEGACMIGFNLCIRELSMREGGNVPCSGRRIGRGAASILAWRADKGYPYVIGSASSGQGGEAACMLGFSISVCGRPTPRERAEIPWSGRKDGSGAASILAWRVRGKNRYIIGRITSGSKGGVL